tara:strand:+ start:138 stop:587 length:450 start_codon:yes stop_codon:yes gene_type:complete
LIKKLLSLITPQENEPEIASEEAIRLAAISLLVQVAKADHSLSEQEESKLVELVNAHFNESKQLEHDELIDLAMAKSDASTSLYEFTSLINENYSMSQKFQLITLMWQIAFSDNVIDSYEEHLIRRVADLVYLPHVKFMEAKHIAQQEN